MSSATASSYPSTSSHLNIPSDFTNFDFSVLPLHIQKRLLILELNVVEAKWTRSIYTLQRSQLVKTYASEFALATKETTNSHQHDDSSNQVSVRVVQSNPTHARSIIPSLGSLSKQTDGEKYFNKSSLAAQTFTEPIITATSSLPPNVPLIDRELPPDSASTSLSEFTPNAPSEFLSREATNLPNDYLWKKLCKQAEVNPDLPLIKLVNEQGSLSKKITHCNFITHVQCIAQFLLTQAKGIKATSEGTPHAFNKFIAFSNNVVVILECILAGWLAGIPCAPLYLDKGKSKFELLNILELIQPQWIILDPSQSPTSTLSFRKWLPKQYILHLYDDVLDLLNSPTFASMAYKFHPVMYIDTHWHPSAYQQQHLRTTNVSSSTVHRHCYWLADYVGSIFLQPYKLSGLSFLISLACLCHGSTLVTIQDVMSHFSFEQWFMLIHTYHVQSSWLRSTTLRSWQPFSTTSLVHKHVTPVKFILLEEPTQNHLTQLTPIAGKLIGFTCCDSLAGLMVGLGEPQKSNAHSSHPFLSNYREIMYLPSLIKFPEGGPHLYVPKAQTLRGHYLYIETFRNVLMVLNLGSSEDLWYPLDESLRYPLLYRAWMLNAFPQLKSCYFFYFCKIPWLLYTGHLDANLLAQFLKQKNQITVFVLVQIQCIDALYSHWHPSFVQTLSWFGAKTAALSEKQAPALTQPSLSKPLHSALTFPTFFEYLILNAKNIPHQAAYIDAEQQLTWQQLSQKTSLGAMYMLKKGLSPGDHILVSYIHSIDYLVILHACLYSGILAVPMPPPDLARLAEEVPRWVSVILEFDIQAILCGGGVFELLHAKPFRHAVKKYSKYCSFPVIHHLSVAQLSIQQPNASQTLGKDGLQLPSHFLSNPTIPAIIHVTFDKEYPKPVCTYTHGQLVYLTQMMAQTLTQLHPTLEKPTLVSCVRTYAGFGLIHALGLGPLLGLPTLLLSTMVFSSDPETWLQRMQHQPVFITKPMIQFARHLGIDLIDRLECPILFHESAIPLSPVPIPCFWEISGAPLAACGSSQSIYLDAKKLCQHGVVHYSSSPQPFTIPISSAGSIVHGGHIEVRPWDNHAPLGDGFGKFMFRYPASSPFRGSLDTYHYGFLAGDHVYPICESIVPHGQGVVPVELMEAMMEQHVGLALFTHTKTTESSIQWTGIVELISSMYYSSSSLPSTSAQLPSQDEPKEVLTHGAMAIIQGYFDIKNFFGISIHRILVLYPGSLPKTRLNEKQRGLAIQQYNGKKLKIVKEFLLG